MGVFFLCMVFTYFRAGWNHFQQMAGHGLTRQVTTAHWCYIQPATSAHCGRYGNRDGLCVVMQDGLQPRTCMTVALGSPVGTGQQATILRDMIPYVRYDKIKKIVFILNKHSVIECLCNIGLHEKWLLQYLYSTPSERCTAQQLSISQKHEHEG